MELSGGGGGRKSGGVGGEMYGGELFSPSSAVVTASRRSNGAHEGSNENPQSQRVSEAVGIWGEFNCCKKKFKPFAVSRNEDKVKDKVKKKEKEKLNLKEKEQQKQKPDGRRKTKTKIKTPPPATISTSNATIERRYGCEYHSNARRDFIAKNGGVPPQWHQFGVWSLSKAQQRFRSVVDDVTKSQSYNEEDIDDEVNDNNNDNDNDDDNDDDDDMGGGKKRKRKRKRKDETNSNGNSNSDSNSNRNGNSNNIVKKKKALPDSEVGRMVCVGGACAWKVKDRSDDVLDEIRKGDKKAGKVVKLTEFEKNRSKYKDW